MHDRRGRDGERRREEQRIRIVPRPNPENSVNPEVRRATKPIGMSAMRAPSIIHRISLSGFDYY
jgi:hypothetical protein